MESTNATGATIGGAEAQLYTFERAVAYCKIVNKTSSGATLYVKWNPAAAASATNYDDEIAQGECLESPPGISVKTVSVYATGALTKDDGYTVRGYV
jgi:hypothetical protein